MVFSRRSMVWEEAVTARPSTAQRRESTSGIFQVTGQDLHDVVGFDAAIPHEPERPQCRDLSRVVGRFGGSEKTIEACGVLAQPVSRNLDFDAGFPHPHVTGIQRGGRQCGDLRVPLHSSLPARNGATKS